MLQEGQNIFGYLSWTSLATTYSIILVCVSIATCFYFKYKFSYWTKRGLKNPPPLPWLGTSFYLLLKPKPVSELEHHRKYGKLYGLYDGYMGTNPTLVCGHPEAIKQITIKHFDAFQNRRKPMTWLSIRYRALTYMRDEEWRQMRITLAPIFTSQKLRKMFELMKRCTDNLHNAIISHQDKEVDLKRLFSVFTVDVISTCCFSMDLKDYINPESDLLLSARSFFNVSRFKMACGMMLPKRLLQAIKFDINDVNSIEFFQQFAQQIINKRRKLAKLNDPNHKKQDDFLQVLIEAANKYSETNENSQSNDNKSQAACQLGDIEILAQAMLFLAVGHETTATLLSSCGYFLALYPQIQERLYDEINQAFIEGNNDISYDKIFELKYLEAFVSESLRYFTPTLTFDREADRDVEIEVDGFKLMIPKGMGVVIPFHAVHHDPDNFEDPDKFDPERFMPENKPNIKPCTFIPFGSGPRFCLASRFALMEVRLALAVLVKNLKFLKSDSTIWPPKYKHHYMLLQMEWPKIKFEKRVKTNGDATDVLPQSQVAA